MDMILIVMGGIIMVIGWFWLMFNAFGESVLWGVGILLCGILGLAYGAMKWDELKVPTIMYGSGLIISIIGNVI